MAKSQKITLTDNNGTIVAQTKDSDLFDIVTTAVSTDTVVSGFHGLAQRFAFFAAGMSVNNYLKNPNKSFNFLK